MIKINRTTSEPKAKRSVDDSSDKPVDEVVSSSSSESSSTLQNCRIEHFAPPQQLKWCHQMILETKMETSRINLKLINIYKMVADTFATNDTNALIGQNIQSKEMLYSAFHVVFSVTLIVVLLNSRWKDILIGSMQ